MEPKEQGNQGNQAVLPDVCTDCGQPPCLAVAIAVPNVWYMGVEVGQCCKGILSMTTP